MTQWRGTRAAAALALLLAAGAAACGPGDGADQAPAAAAMDTTNADPMDGLSSEQVQGRAEALTPEEAAARGLTADTSIHLENLSSQDTTPPGASSAGASPANPGTVPPGRTDTVPPRVEGAP